MGNSVLAGSKDIGLLHLSYIIEKYSNNSFEYYHRDNKGRISRLSSCPVGC